MIAVLILGLLAAACAADSDYAPAPTYNDVKGLLDVVETGKEELLEALSTINTACSGFDDKFSTLKHEALPFWMETNEYQTQLLDTIRAQLKDIRHGVDNIDSTAKSLIPVAQSTSNEQQRILQRIGLGDQEHASRIGSLGSQLVLTKEEILNNLTDTKVQFYDIFKTGIADTVQTIAEAVNSRTCQTGFGVFEPGTTTAVSFKRAFPGIPQVTIQAVGFASHLLADTYDDHHGHEADYLSIDTYVSSTDPSSFDVAVGDIAEGDVALKAVAVRWSACYYLNVDFGF